MVKFRSDVVGSVNSLGCSKHAFYLISLADGSLLVLCVRVVHFLGRPAQWAVVAIDMAGLDVLPVLLPQIEPVGQNFLGQHDVAAVGMLIVLNYAFSIVYNQMASDNEIVNVLRGIYGWQTEEPEKGVSDDSFKDQKIDVMLNDLVTNYGCEYGNV